VIFAKIDVSLRHHYRLRDVSPDSVSISLGLPSKLSQKRAASCVRLARSSALGVWTFALLYTRDHMLDGFCPLTAIDEFAVDETVEELVRQGLLARAERDGREGVVIVNYAKHNETKAAIERRLELDRARKSPDGTGRGRRTVSDPVRPGRPGIQADSDRVPAGGRTDSGGIPSPESETESETESEVKGSPSQAPAGRVPREERRGEHRELVAHFAAEFERLKGVKPVIGAKGGAGAKRLLVGRTLAEAKAIVDRALADPWWLDRNPDLAAIAGKINSFIGRRAAPSGGSQVPLQPATGTWKKAEVAK
jgi:hypothetical protein